MSVNSGPEAWLLHDGRAGHWRQVSALAGFLPLQTSVLPFSLSPPWRWFAPYRLPFGLAAHPGLLANAARPPHIILSCGRRSALAARWIQHHFEGRPKTVQILDCGLPPDRFNWVIAPRHDGLDGDNVISTTGSLNPVNEAWLARLAGPRAAGASAPGPSCVLLLGGPSANFAFSRRWFRSALALVCDHSEGGSLTIVESPRTPRWVAEIISRLPDTIPVNRLAWDPQDPDGAGKRYGAALARADVVFVSADSVNLVSEACASGKPVGLLGSGQAKGKIGRFGHRLVAEGFAVNCEPGLIKDGSMPVTRCLRETEAVAERLIRSGLME